MAFIIIIINLFYFYFWHRSILEWNSAIKILEKNMDAITLCPYKNSISSNARKKERALCQACII